MVQMNAKKNAQAYENWISNGIEGFDKFVFEVGKFLFGVSSGTIGVAVSLFTFAEVKVNEISFFGVFDLVLAAGVALRIVIPEFVTIKPLDQLEGKHHGAVQRWKRQLWLWFALWTIGVTITAFSLVYGNQGAEVDPRPMKIEIVSPN